MVIHVSSCLRNITLVATIHKRPHIWTINWSTALNLLRTRAEHPVTRSRTSKIVSIVRRVWVSGCTLLTAAWSQSFCSVLNRIAAFGSLVVVAGGLHIACVNWCLVCAVVAIQLPDLAFVVIQVIAWALWKRFNWFGVNISWTFLFNCWQFSSRAQCLWIGWFLACQICLNISRVFNRWWWLLVHCGRWWMLFVNYWWGPLNGWSCLNSWRTNLWYTMLLDYIVGILTGKLWFSHFNVQHVGGALKL